MVIRASKLVPRRRRLVGGAIATLGSVVVLSIAALAFASGALAAQAPVNLGTTAGYAVLAGTTVTNTGPTTVSGDLGLSPGSSVTGFPPGLVSGGVQNVANAAAVQAQSDLVTAYNDAAGRTPATTVAGDTLGGLTLTAGVYSGGALGLTGTLTLDAQGDSGAVFIFQAASTLITASASQVKLVNGASPCNVFWKVGSSATLGTTTSFKGTILALTSIGLNTGATVDGRLLARNGAVTLDSNTINELGCSGSPGRSPTTTVTEVHNPSHHDITNGSVLSGTAVHDSSTVTGAAPSGTITYHFFATGNGACSGASTDQTVAVGTESSPQTLAVGSYAYSADYSGDSNNQPSTSPCEPFNIVSTDTSPPICVIVAQGKDALGRGFLRFRVQDVGSGLQRFVVVDSYNAIVTVDAFVAPTTAPVFVTATGTNKKAMGVEVDFFDAAGNRAVCDPILHIVSRDDVQPTDTTFTGIAQAECKVTILNGDPGMRKVQLIVNGQRFKEVDLRNGEVRKLDICAAMRPGTHNSITVRARGKKGASAVVVIADID
jgi:hypothetical protein